MEIIGEGKFYQNIGRLFIRHDMLQDVVHRLQINSEKQPAASKQGRNIFSHNLVLGCCTVLINKTITNNRKGCCARCNTVVTEVVAYFLQFEGPEGEWFQKLTARFCSHQSWALDQIKSRQKKDARFNSFILVWLAQSGARTIQSHHHAMQTLTRARVQIPGGREQTSVPQATAEGHHSNRDAEADQIPTAAGEHRQEHG